MLAASASALLQFAVLATGAQPYDTAIKQAQSNGQPLLVLVGTDWCPGCQTMKTSVLPRMASRGLLKRVNYATVDAEAEGETASRLMRGGAIPQLIVYSQRPGGDWHREQITGTASEDEIAALIERARQAQSAQAAAQVTTVATGRD